MPTGPPTPERAPLGPGPDDRRLRPAARLAVAVAAEGERADPRVPAPAELRAILGFSRLSAASYRIVHRVVDEDGVFRARVAEAADERDVGRVGWLWLHRPVGWLDDPAVAGPHEDASSAEEAERAPDERQASTRHRAAARQAEAARRRTAEELSEVRRQLRALEAEHRALRDRAEELEAARAAALRSAKEAEAALALARRDLKVARAATREAEAELAAARAATGGAPEDGRGGAPSSAEAPVAPPEADAPGRDELAAGVAEAGRAAGALADALGRIAERLGSEPRPRPGLQASSPEPTPSGRASRPGRSTRRASRRPPDLPPGLFEGSEAADRHLVADRANLLVVDGYNLARTAWQGLALEEERRRTVELVEEVQARSGARATVVFDGRDEVVGPVASRRVQVRFSATGQTADDAIVALLDALPDDGPVVVVSSDRAVGRDVRARGATVLSSPAFLAAAGR
ncbi:MAG TPA: NYN domain-containing protein [Aquihabitans sp.]|nr:NYN domain-containing protein [Aquihabitans sp.]